MAHGRVEGSELLWQRLQVLRDGASTHQGDILWVRKLALAEAQMGNLDAALAALEAIRELPGVKPEDHFLEAACHWESGDGVSMRAAIIAAQERAHTLGKGDVAERALGGYFEGLGEWDKAAAAYIEEFEYRNGTRSGSYALSGLAKSAFSAGNALDRCYRWAEAEGYYLLASYLEANNARTTYKIGLTLERQEKWEAAARFFLKAAAIATESQKKFFRYKATFCLTSAGLWREACNAFICGDVVENDCTDGVVLGSFHIENVRVGLDKSSRRYSSSPWVADAVSSGIQGDTRGEIASLEEAIVRSVDHPSVLHERAGLAYFRANEFEKAAIHFVQSRLFRRPDGINMKPYLGRSAVASAARYAEYRRYFPVDLDVIFFESFHGAKINCHPLAIFRFLLQKPEYAHKRFVWAITPGKDVPQELHGHDNVIVAEVGSDLYQKYLATAGWLITNVTLPPHFVRRAEQKYLNTWHGTPIKTLGKDTASGNLEHANVSRNFLQATHLISTCAWTTEVLLDRYDIRDVYAGSIAETGAPRVDLSIGLSASRRATILEELGIPEGKPVVLYAPTWRGLQGNPSLDASLTREAIAALRAVPEATILFRGHHLAEKGLFQSGLESMLVPEKFDTNELLGIVDVLITDYSSVFFDFLVFDKPIIFLTPDESEFREERGLYYNIDDLPGVACRETEELVATTRTALDLAQGVGKDPYASRREEWRREYSPHEDGSASSRAVRFFFENDMSCAVSSGSEKPLVLLRSSLLPNGITTSARNLVESIDPDSVKLVNIIPPSVLHASEERRQQFDLVPDHVSKLGRSGVPCFTPEERWVIMSFNKHGRFFSEEHRRIARTAYAREFERVLGTARFDAVVEFDGYAGFWANLLGSAENVSRKVVYQHNDLYAEWVTKYPELSAVFCEYAEFDQVVAISPSISSLNRDSLSERFNIDPDKFVHAHNQVDPARVSQLAGADLDADVLKWLKKSEGHIFVAMGRLSPEKSHDLLLESFALASRRRRARLIVIGSGFLQKDLEAQARRLGISKKVFFAGQRTNPMPILSASDTFVLTSAHEGQPMVIGEAMMLGLPVVATNLPGIRDLLKRGSSVLVDHEVGAFAKAMVDAVDGEIATVSFDAEAHRILALSDFSRVTGVTLDAAKAPTP